MQYFERARMEYHPEYAGTEYAVLLGRLIGNQLDADGWIIQRRPAHPDPPRVPVTQPRAATTAATISASGAMPMPPS